ncbi:MAG: adenylate kinase [Candidatus Aenigmatarchaeota archaeon]
MRLIFLGPPGVGKGTYASRIGPKMGIPHISTGDLFREHMKNETELGKRAKEFIDRGELVPDEITIQMLQERLSRPECEKGFILDGFPRTAPQAEALDRITEIDKVVNITLREDIIVRKIAARRICRDCGEIYNLADIREGEIVMPPLLPKKEGICDKCGGEIYQRDDDREEVVRDRLKVYEKNTAPLIEYYRKKDIMVDVEVKAGPEIMVPIIMKLLGAE